MAAAARRYRGMQFEDANVVGVAISEWLAVFDGCHTWMGQSLFRQEWPNGLCYLEQEMSVLRIFAIFKEQIQIVVEQESGK